MVKKSFPVFIWLAKTVCQAFRSTIINKLSSVSNGHQTVLLGFRYFKIGITAYLGVKNSSFQLHATISIFILSRLYIKCGGEAFRFSHFQIVLVLSLLLFESFSFKVFGGEFLHNVRSYFYSVCISSVFSMFDFNIFLHWLFW